MMPIDRVLQGLTKVRQRQPGQYSACCPAHDDRGPSLSVRETPDGAVLLYCHAGCTPEEITAALGLDMADLFPPRETPANAPKRIARLLTAGQALELLADESNFIAVTAANIGNGVQLAQDDIDRALLSAGRVRWMQDQVIGGQQ
jgi:hypothetical protein